MINFSLSIVIPVYNEAESVKGVLENLRGYLEANIENYEIVCVNDCSTDNSSKKAAEPDKMHLHQVLIEVASSLVQKQRQLWFCHFCRFRQLLSFFMTRGMFCLG